MRLKLITARARDAERIYGPVLRAHDGGIYVETRNLVAITTVWQHGNCLRDWQIDFLLSDRTVDIRREL